MGGRRAAGALILAAVVAACGSSTTPTASPSPAPSATPSPNPGGSPSPVPSPSASPSPSGSAYPSAATGGPVVELAIARMTAEPFISGIDLEQTSHLTTDTTTVDFTSRTVGRISGQDLFLVVTGTSGGVQLKSELIVVGDAIYASDHDGPWQVGRRAQVAQSLDQILEGLRRMPAAAELADLGEEQLEGSTVHHLAIVGPTDFDDDFGGHNTFVAFDLWILDDGTPVLRKETLVGVKGSLHSTGHDEIRYDAFGIKNDIKPPKLPPSPSPSRRPTAP